MKFAFVIFKYFPYGGAQRDMLRIAQACVARGHEVHIFTQSWEGLPPNEGIVLHVLPSKGWFNHRRYRNFIHQVHSQIEKEHFDHIVGFNRMPGLSVHFAADSCFLERAQTQRNPLQRLSGRYRFFAECERAVFASDSDCEILLLSPREKLIFQRWYNTPETRFHLLPPCLAPDRHVKIDVPEARNSVRSEFGFAMQDQILLLVGSGFKTKGLDRAIYALAALPEDMLRYTRLLVVGQDNAKSFASLAHKLGVDQNVIFCQGRDDISRLMHAADLLIHPARAELAGHVLIEAMASGLPILASDVCGYAFHVQKAGAGTLVPSPFDQEHFNSQLQHMLTQDRTDWQNAGRQYASQLIAANDGTADAVMLETFPPRIRN